MQTDPIGMAGGNNLYGYTQGRPGTFTDAAGLLAGGQQVNVPALVGGTAAAAGAAAILCTGPQLALCLIAVGVGGFLAGAGAGYWTAPALPGSGPGAGAGAGPQPGPGGGTGGLPGGGRNPSPGAGPTPGGGAGAGAGSGSRECRQQTICEQKLEDCLNSSMGSRPGGSFGRSVCWDCNALCEEYGYWPGSTNAGESCWW